MSELTALREALEAEQAVVYGYGVVGSHLHGKGEDLAASRLIAHQELRDRLVSLITAFGAMPAPAQPAYELPFPVTDASTARQLAAHLENGAAGAAWDLAASSARQSSARQHAAGWLSDAAVAASRWGATLPALPGRAS